MLTRSWGMINVRVALWGGTSGRRRVHRAEENRQRGPLCHRRACVCVCVLVCWCGCVARAKRFARESSEGHTSFVTARARECAERYSDMPKTGGGGLPLQH